MLRSQRFYGLNLLIDRQCLRSLRSVRECFVRPLTLFAGPCYSFNLIMDLTLFWLVMNENTIVREAQGANLG